jgi:hypothetical protein
VQRYNKIRTKLVVYVPDISFVVSSSRKDPKRGRKTTRFAGSRHPYSIILPSILNHPAIDVE